MPPWYKLHSIEKMTKTDIYIKPDIKISVLYHLIKEKKSLKGEEATFAVYEK
jgi:hypothetical protein